MKSDDTASIVGKHPPGLLKPQVSSLKSLPKSRRGSGLIDTH
jgi:hypothetical protein